MTVTGHDVFVFWKIISVISLCMLWLERRTFCKRLVIVILVNKP